MTKEVFIDCPFCGKSPERRLMSNRTKLACVNPGCEINPSISQATRVFMRLSGWVDVTGTAINETREKWNRRVK